MNSTPGKNSSLKKLKSQLQVEVDASYLYGQLASIQTDKTVASIFESMSGIEHGHADHMLAEIREQLPNFQFPSASGRARFQWRLGKIFGYDFIISGLTSVEKQVAKSEVESKLKRGDRITGYELNHLRIIETISNRISGSSTAGSFISKMEGRHKSVGGNALRAAVLGANDGLVSNMSLVMGVAGASANNKIILITGFAGLLAGAISMALGEWLSVQSSRELLSKQIELEAEELESSPEQEKKELVLLYRAKGMEIKDAEELANKVFENKETALDTLVKEELGIDKNEMGGSPWEAAFASFFLFSIGAILPIIPFLFVRNANMAIYTSLGFSVVGLFIIGSAITLFTGKGLLFSGIRQMIFGLGAAGITFAIGKLIGVSISG